MWCFFFSGQTKRTRIWHFVRVELSFSSSVLQFFFPLFSVSFLRGKESQRTSSFFHPGSSTRYIRTYTDVPHVETFLERASVAV